MYSIILSDGKTININATNVELVFNEKIARFYHGDAIVARINMNNIVGLVKTDHMIDPDPYLIYFKEEKK